MPILQQELVAKGTAFSEAFVVNPLCCPSRASTLTGRYSHSTGIYDNGGTYGGFAAFGDTSTLATWLHDAGYRTGLIGKYLNGYDDASYVPPGWDRWTAFVGGANYLDYSLSHDGVRVDHGTDDADYSTDVLAAEAAGFIGETPQDQPLFLAFTPFAPHAGWIPAARHHDAFPDFEGVRPPNLNEEDVSDKPAWVRNLEYTPDNYRDTQQLRQAQSLLAVDEAIAEILAALDEAGRTSETFFVFTSDNGLSTGSHRWSTKTTPWDEATRVPLVVRYDPFEQVATSDRFALNVDLAPTIAAVAGVAAPGAEGASLVPLLQGRTDGWRTSFLIENYAPGVPTDSPPSYCAVRSHEHLYVRYATGEEELYDQAVDPFQLQSVHDDPAYADVKRGLVDELMQLCSPPPPGYSFGGSAPAELTTPQDVAVATGLWDGVAMRTYGSYPMDVDLDELTDVLLVPHVAKPARLLHNDGGSFSLITTFPKRDRHGCAAADVDLNGLPDIYCSIGADSGTGVKANELWMQTEPGTFFDRGAALGVADPYGRGREVAFVDANHDPYPDLYVTNEYPRADGVPSPNHLFINDGGSGFHAAPEYGLDVEVGGVLGIQTCVQAEDVSGDGWQDSARVRQERAPDVRTDGGHLHGPARGPPDAQRRVLRRCPGRHERRRRPGSGRAREDQGRRVPADGRAVPCGGVQPCRHVAAAARGRRPGSRRRRGHLRRHRCGFGHEHPRSPPGERRHGDGLPFGGRRSGLGGRSLGHEPGSRRQRHDRPDRDERLQDRLGTRAAPVVPAAAVALRSPSLSGRGR